MRLERRIIPFVVALACIAYASSAMAGFNPGPIPINRPAIAGEPSGDHSSKPLAEFPADAPCDISRLTKAIDGFQRQKAALAQELIGLKSHLKMAQVSAAPETFQAALAAQIEDLQHRIAALENRESIVRNRINQCKGVAEEPAPDGNGKPAATPADKPTFHPDDQPTSQMRISCKVPKGEQVRAVVFRNIGQRPIPSGTPVTWYVKAAGQGGQFLLPRALSVGADLTASDLLKLGVPGSTGCRSKLS